MASKSEQELPLPLPHLFPLPPLPNIRPALTVLSVSKCFVFRSPLDQCTCCSLFLEHPLLFTVTYPTAIVLSLNICSSRVFPDAFLYLMHLLSSSSVLLPSHPGFLLFPPLEQLSLRMISALYESVSSSCLTMEHSAWHKIGAQ